MDKKLFLAWQSQKTRKWFVVGVLSWDGEFYSYSYTVGFFKAKEFGLDLLAGFPREEEVYRSKKLFPFFQNRLLKESRSDFAEYLRYLDLKEKESDHIEILNRSGGRRVTDQYFVFGFPNIYGGYIEYNFFTNGLRYLDSISKDYFSEISKGDHLYLCPDIQNEEDPEAILVRTEKCLIGWCPRYLCPDFLSLLGDQPLFVEAKLDGINPPPAPIQFRFRCKIKALKPKMFEPFSGPEYQPLVPFSTTTPTD